MRSRVYYIIAVISFILIIIWLHIALFPEGGLFAILDVLLTVNLFWLLPAFGLFGVAYVLRAVRWWLLLRPFKTGGNPVSLFPIIVGGIFLTYVVPLRAGDIATPYWLREKRGTRFTAGLSSVLIARFLDFASLILIAVIFTILIFGAITGSVTEYLVLGGLLGIAFVAFFLLIRSERFVGFLSRILTRVFKPSQRLSEEVPKFVENAAVDMRSVISSRNSGFALLTSVPLWLIETAKLVFLGLAVGVPIPLATSCFAASLSYIGGHGAAVLIPAGIGIFLFQTIALGTMLSGIATPTLVASIALLDGLIYIIGLTVLGVPSIASMGRGYRELQEDE